MLLILSLVTEIIIDDFCYIIETIPANSPMLLKKIAKSGALKDFPGLWSDVFPSRTCLSL